MRTIFLLWLFPLLLFWGWHFASVYDVGGVFFLTKDFNTHIYLIYSNILQIPAEDIPAAMAWLFFVDSVLLFFGVAIIAWWKSWFYPLKDFIKTKIFGIEAAEPKTQIDVLNQDIDEKDIKTIGPVHPAE